MQSQQQIRINAGPTTAALALITTLVLGGFAGYGIAIATKAPVVIPLTEQLVQRSEATQQDPVTRPALEQGRMCTPNFTCLESNESGAPFTQQLPMPKPTLDEGRVCTPDLRTCLEAGSSTAPTFEEGRMCTSDFKFCREPQNSYD